MSKLQYSIPDPDEMRTCVVFEDQGNGDTLQLFKFQTFSHNRRCETDFQRYNKHTNRYETAGGIKWNDRSVNDSVVTFGVVTVILQEVRQVKKATSISRRFQWNNSEYKWKRMAENDLACYDWLKRVVALYKAETKELEVSGRGYAILDQIVVTCLLHRYMLSLGQW